MNNSPWAVITNPAAGGGISRKLLPKLEKLLDEHGISYRIVKTEARLHAVSLVDALVKEGIRKFASLGGDGTHHEVINGMMKQFTCPVQELLFSALPAGTGNDWIKQYGIKNNLAFAVGRMKEGGTATQTVGKIRFINAEGEREMRYFMNVAGAAYDAEVVHGLMDKSRDWTGLVYLLEGIRKLHQFRPKHVVITSNDRSWEGDILTFNAGICRYSGGGMSFVPHAEPASGHLAFTILPYRRPRALLSRITLLYNGKVHRFPDAKCWTGDQAMLASKDEVMIEADGEFLGYSPFEIRVAEEKLHFVC